MKIYSNNNRWRGLEPTPKQLELIQDMMEFCEPNAIPRFTGKTRGEASDYIERYKKVAHETYLDLIESSGNG